MNGSSERDCASRRASGVRLGEITQLGSADVGSRAIFWLHGAARLVLTGLLLASVSGVANAAPHRRAHHSSISHRQTVRRQDKVKRKHPKRVCDKTVVRVRTSKFLELRSKERCF